METTILPIDNPESIQRALVLLKKSGLVAFPTDTVYGLGASAFDGKAIEEIYIAKSRRLEKSIPILIGDIHDLERVAVEIPEIAIRLADRFWPGPLTLLIPKREGLPRQVSSTATVGVRMPDHPFALNLLRRAGPMAVSSANLSGQDSPTTAEEVMNQLTGRVSLILDGGRTPGGIPSTVVDCLGVELAIVREGPISMDQILAVK
jgi:L-threonylcarbamoyladenylate synthase